MKKLVVVLAAVLFIAGCGAGKDSPAVSGGGEIRMYLPVLKTNNKVIDDAYRIAIGDLVGNIRPYKNRLLGGQRYAILAGLDYGRPWTRDASINAWNGGSLIVPEVSRDTLISVLKKDNGGVRIGGEYWDCIIWATGAWNHYLYTGDEELLALAFEATVNTLKYFEETEFDAEFNLFRGPGWSDGIAAYPDVYSRAGGTGAISLWPRYNPDKISKPGVGIPMMAISTNCLYYNGYVAAQKMAEELDKPDGEEWAKKAKKLKEAINKHLWMTDKGTYKFFIGPFGGSQDQEAVGHAYAIMFGVASRDQAEAIFENQHVTAAGVPCGWPNISRYESEDGMSFGRHSGTVWPQIQGMWADAAARFGKVDIFSYELLKLAEHARRDLEFAEIYHPITGEKYGGLQERRGKGIDLWIATARQTWAATAYLRMIYMGVTGMRFDTDGVRFSPCVPKEISEFKLSHLKYRDAEIDIEIKGSGTVIDKILINGQERKETFLPADSRGNQKISIAMKNN